MTDERRTVVGAVTIKDNKLLAFRRPLNKANAGLWEFVGGKVEPGESETDALIRECQEEIDTQVVPKELIYSTDFDYPDIKITLKLYDTELDSEDITLKEHLEYKWIPLEKLDDYQFCPADEPFLLHLKEKRDHYVLS